MATSDIFDRLIKDHEKHRTLIAAIMETEGDSEDRRSLFDQFKTEVTAHAATEEETLYATLMQISEGRHDAQHSVAEHKELGDLIEELAEADMGSSGWLNRFKTLRHDYLHHIDEEEEEMFPNAKKLIEKSEAVELKQEFEERKPEEIERAEAGADEGDSRE
jgi:hypothetical protein